MFLSKMIKFCQKTSKKSSKRTDFFCSYSLMGSSGCGKTTLISSLVGLCSFDSGTIKLFGVSPGKCQTLRIGYMPQEAALINNFKVKEIIWFFGTIYGLHKRKIKERFKFLSALIELPDKEKLIEDCSGGEQRRISLALTMIHEPELLILDEATVGLDSLMRNTIWDYLIELAETKNVTILLSTHYIEEARRSHRVGFMRNGAMVAEESPQKILEICQTYDMEEAFLQFCQKQETKVLTHFPTYIDSEEFPRKNESQVSKFTKRSQSPSKIIYALLMKSFLDIVKNFR